MIKTIAKKEFTGFLRDGRFLTVSLILLVWLVFSGFLGWQHYSKMAEGQISGQESQREKWLNKQVASAHLAAHTGTIVFRSSLPLAAIDRGLDPYVGTSIFLEAHRRNDFAPRPLEELTKINRFTEITIAFTFQILLPLLIILLSYSAISVEKENGTLRQVVSLGVSPKDFVIGKIIGLTTPIIILLAPVILFGIFLLFAVSSADSADFSGRLWLMLVFYLLYLGLFLALSFSVSALSSSSQKSLVILVGFWFLTCLVALPLFAETGQKFYPNLTEKDFTREKPNAEEELALYEKKMAEIEERMLTQYGVTNKKDLPIDLNAVLIADSEKESSQLAEEDFKKIQDIYEKQNRIYQLGAVFSPAIAVQLISNGLAGEDNHHYLHFAEEAEKYRFDLVQKLNEDLINNPSKGNREERETAYRQRERELYERVPPFEYRKPDWTWALTKLSLPILLLLAWLLLTLATLRLAIVKMRVD